MAGRAFSKPFINPERSPRGRFGLNFQAGYGCPAFKEPFLSLETTEGVSGTQLSSGLWPYIKKPFLAQADSGTQLSSQLWLPTFKEPISGA
jgi:hypothetical protein